MKARLIGEKTAGMTAVEIYDDQNVLVWSNRYFDSGATNAGYIAGMLQVLDDMIGCENVADYGMFDEDGEPIVYSDADTTGVICEYDVAAATWHGGDYGFGQSTEIAAALMLAGKLPVDDEVIDTHEGDKVVAELVKKLKPGYVIVYESSDAPGGVKLVGNPEDCTLEYPDTVLVFDNVEQAKAYINDHEPLLGAGNIKPAYMWL